MEALLGILLLVLGFAVYLGGYLLVPLVISSQRKMTKGKINIIVIVNTLVVFILFQLWNPYLTTNIVMGLISIFIGRRILISKCLKTETEDAEQSEH